MTDYFNFPKLSNWWEKKSLLAEGFGNQRNFLNRVKVFQRQSDYAIRFTESIGPQQLFQFEEMFPPTSSFFSGLHSLTICADCFVNDYIGKILDTAKHTIKRLFLKGGLEFVNFTLPQLTEEMIRRVDACCKKVQDLELDELCIWLHLDCRSTRTDEIIKTNKAKRLRIFCVSDYDVTHRTRLWQELIPLEKVSEINITYTGRPTLFHFSKLTEPITDIRSETLQCVRFDCCNLFTEETFNQNLHIVLFDVCICLCDVGMFSYHVYFILEFLPAMRGHNRAKVVQALERIFASINAVKERRTEKLHPYKKIK